MQAYSFKQRLHNADTSTAKVNPLSAGCVNAVVAWDTDYRRHADQQQKNLLLIQT